MSVATKSVMINKLNIKPPKNTFKEYFILTSNSYLNFNKIIIRLY